MFLVAIHKLYLEISKEYETISEICTFRICERQPAEAEKGVEENSALRGGGAFGDFGAVALDLLLSASHANVGINAREGENFKPMPNIWRNEILLNSDNRIFSFIIRRFQR